MTKIRVHNPLGGGQIGVNTDQITSWWVDGQAEFVLYAFTSDGKTITAPHDQGGKELLEILEVEFYPLNEKPVIAEVQP